MAHTIQLLLYYQAHGEHEINIVKWLNQRMNRNWHDYEVRTF